MECSCSVGNDCENDELLGYSERILKAAKDHICYECGNPILKGQEFIFCSILMVEDIRNFKMCLICAEIATAFFKNGFTFGQMISDLNDYLYHAWRDDLPSDYISKLSPSAQAVVCDSLQEFQEE
jgi:hypothetical protein